MAVPKSKISKSRRGQRRAHDALDRPNWQTCPDSGELKLSHRVCMTTGMYRGRQIFVPKAERRAAAEEASE